MKQPELDRDRIKVAVRRLKREQLLDVLDRALNVVPQDDLEALIQGFARRDDLLKAGDDPGSQLAEVKAFRDASLRGDNWQEFAVNSKNYMEKSLGTQAWLEECYRILRRIAKLAAGLPAIAAREAFEGLFDLMRRVDESDEILFFAEEGGSWMVGVDWREILPSYFGCLAKTSSPEEHALAVRKVLNEHGTVDSAGMIEAARAVATSEQRDALR